MATGVDAWYNGPTMPLRVHHSGCTLPRLLVLLLLLSLFSGAGIASTSFDALPLSALPHSPVGGPLLATTSVSADLDGDCKPDHARSEWEANLGYVLKVRFSHRSTLHLPLNFATDGRYIARDFDRDGDLDLIVLGLVSAPTPVRIWLNDGKGRFQPSFTIAPFADSVFDDRSSLFQARNVALCSSLLEISGVVPPLNGIRRPAFLFSRARSALPRPLATSTRACFASCLTRRGPPSHLSSLPA